MLWLCQLLRCWTRVRQSTVVESPNKPTAIAIRLIDEQGSITNRTEPQELFPVGNVEA